MKVESSTIISHDSKTTSNTVKLLTDRLDFFTTELINNALHRKRITLTNGTDNNIRIKNFYCTVLVTR